MNKLKQFITKYNKLLMEVLYVSIVILACSLISMCSLFYKSPDEIKTALSYKYNFYFSFVEIIPDDFTKYCLTSFGCETFQAQRRMATQRLFKILVIETVSP